MNHPDIFIAIVIVLSAALAAEYFSLRSSRFKAELNACLRKGNYCGYCEMLGSKEGKRIFRRYEGKLKQLDAAVELSRHEEVRRLFRELDLVRMASPHFIDYNMKKLAYAIDRQDPGLAAEAWETIHKHKFGKHVIREADQLYDIYVLHKSNHIEELKEFAERARNPSSKGMAFFRIAKQYYYQNDLETCRTYLRRAKAVYPDETWQGIIGGILDGDDEKLR